VCKKSKKARGEGETKKDEGVNVWRKSEKKVNYSRKGRAAAYYPIKQIDHTTKKRKRERKFGIDKHKETRPGLA